MLEVIGVLFIAWVVWKIVKESRAASTKLLMQRGAAYAVDFGVPPAAAGALAAHPAKVKLARQHLAAVTDGFGGLDKYRQCGMAIARLYESREEPEPAKENSGATSKETSFGDTVEKVKHIVVPQIEAVRSEGLRLSVGAIEYAYVGALAMALSGNSVKLIEIKTIVEECFAGEEFAFDIENGWNVVLHSSDFFDNMAALTPVAVRECQANEGDYFVKFSRKNRADDGIYRGPRRDFSKLSKTWFLDV